MSRVLKARRKRRAVVTTHDGKSFSGVLYEADREALVLRNAKALTRDGGEVSIDGELLLLTLDVAYVQLP
jgi:small nuclear ribonucleoprotein (snRNP)-like protein